MMLLCRNLANSVIVTVSGCRVVQHVCLPHADLIPFLHHLCELNQRIRIGHIRRINGVEVVFCASPHSAGVDTVNSNIVRVRTNPAAYHGSILCTVRIPGDNIRISFLHISKVSCHIFPAMYAVLKPCFFRPVETIRKTVVCPLCVVILGHQINLSVIFAELPVFSGNAFPSLGGILLQHILRKLKECTVLGIRPCIQPVRSRTNQVNRSVHTGKCQVVVGKIICPGNKVSFQLSVYFLCKNRIQLLHHFLIACQLVT